MRVVIATGGTGGHIYPGIEVAEALKMLRPDSSFVFVGPRGKMDEEAVKASGYESATIDVSGFARGPGAKAILSNARALYKLATLRPVLEAKKLLSEFGAQVAFATGGYVAGPVILAAWLLRLPRAILEANVVPGLANRLLQGVADVIFLGFEPAARHFAKAKKVIISGNPVRRGDEVRGRKLRSELGFEDGRALIVAVGGSLGSRLINRIVVKSLLQLAKEKEVADKIQVLHCVGRRFWDQFISQNSRLVHSLPFKYLPVPYLPELHNLLFATQIVISRAGAMTLSEMAQAGPAAVLIPWAGASNNEQVANAEFFQQNHAAIVLDEKQLDHNTLSDTISELVLDQHRQAEVAANCKRLGKPGAGREIASLLVSLAARRSE